MNFDFNEDQYAFQEIASRLLTDNFPLQADLSADKTRSSRLWASLRDLGLFALPVPEAFDGLGLDSINLALPMEELGKAVAPLSIAHTLAAADLIGRYGTQAQKEKLLPSLAAGNLRISIASQEESASYDLHDATSVKGGQSLHTVKLLAPDADEADYFLVTAKTASGRPAVFLIDRARPGVLVSKQKTIDPAAAFHRCLFDGLKISDIDMLGSAAPEQAAHRLFDVCATLYAGMALGVAARLLELSVRYAKERTQFGKPIGSFQAIKHKCADMAVAV
ncbi:MAG: acyl-CoA dehydrogenase family protein, partial [Caulobacterales bacterium]